MLTMFAFRRVSRVKPVIYQDCERVPAVVWQEEDGAG